MRRARLLITAVIAVAAGCAATAPSVALAPTSCAQLGWDDCGRAPACRHDRAWSDDTETWICTRRPWESTDLPAPSSAPSLAESEPVP